MTAVLRLSRVRAHADVFAQSSQYLSRANTSALPARVDAAVGLSVRPTAQPIWLGLDAQNLLDERGEDLYGYPLPGRALYAWIRLEAPSLEHP